MNSFCTTSSKIKLMIAISAFGLGVDITDVRRVIIGGFQVTWRSMHRRQGMLDEMACLLIAILHEGKSGRYVNKEMNRRMYQIKKFAEENYFSILIYILRMMLL